MVQTKSVCERVEGKTGLTGRTSLLVKIPASEPFIGDVVKRCFSGSVLC